jgi:hypothetical protein
MATTPVRHNTRAMQRLYLVATGLVLILGTILFGLSTRTDRFFAWTIPVPLTAALLGAAYLGSGFGEIAAARTRIWAESRIAMPGVLVFSALTGGLTLVHREAFHFSGGYPVTARVVAWGWAIVYVAFPIASVVVLLGQARVAGADPAPARPLPAGFRVALAAQGALMFAVGAALFVVPGPTRGIWPWPLTDLTARAVGAWAIGLAVGCLQAIAANDWSRVRVAMPFFAGVGVLALVAIVRFPQAVDWRRPAAWILIALLVSLVLTGGYGLLRARAAGEPAGPRNTT